MRGDGRIGFRAPEAALSCVVGVGASLWERLFDAPLPPELHPFRELRGPVHTAPSTPGDVFFHLRAARLDLCFELRLIADRFGERVRVVDEVHGFRAFDERDLLGFVDGTENPEGGDAEDAVLIDTEEDQTHAGGSYLCVQKYTHDLAGWNALTVEEQEAAMGRTKLDDVEFADEDKAPDAHLSLNVIGGPDGEERQVMRFNMPFGRVGSAEFGTFYIAYAKEASVIEEMLDNMFLGKGEATHDRLLDFSTALTGNLYFVPGADFLDDPPAKGGLPAEAGAPTGTPAPADPAIPAAPPADDSLGIGSLR